MFKLSQVVRERVKLGSPQYQYASLEQVVAASKKLGLTYISVSDTSPSVMELRIRFQIPESVPFIFDAATSRFTCFSTVTDRNLIMYQYELNFGDSAIRYVPRLLGGALNVQLAAAMGFNVISVPLGEPVVTLPLPQAGSWFEIDSACKHKLESVLMLLSEAQALRDNFFAETDQSLRQFSNNT